ncbi:DUF3136 domain-containing protein [Synechococcus sp. EJ6-Ellesmere]|uniref:DUF3136 domain-containing protein n=1 Tax=Synechococcus sp. EJ6-Ellesmere TaxID=2823734 RepID=UPI0020CBA774|nr:DUF3136 domain-containing protein [Synechococcus sp. EJ6-Ellesmere]MCP9824569.1 DUF3136 domain-containing protein [Synechococcus sp. EJ6-Ellesmere]
MAKAADPAPSLTVGELEANYALYCKAMRILAREGKSATKARRTVCWQRLEMLHHCLPNQYRDPDYLYLLLSRERATS